MIPGRSTGNSPIRKREEGHGPAVGRIFNTYGPRMHPNDGRVVSNFIVQALKGKPIPLRDGLIRTIEYFRSHPGVLPE